MSFYTVEYMDDRLSILDCQRLPGEEVYIDINTLDECIDAIKKLKVRGAPAIGICAGFGLYVSIRDVTENFEEVFYENVKKLAASRPTAVNLFKALDRMKLVYEKNKERDLDMIKKVLLEEAQKIYDEDVYACKMMGEYGLSLLKPEMGILTHCNAGALAASKYGTCLAPIHLGQERGYDFRVYSDETRPLLQGARMTCWELAKDGVDVTVICDNMASIVMKQGKIDAVVVGCDRMAANGDAANKIGTSGVAILAKEYGIPMYFFVPTSTIDLDTKTGEDIVIEERDPEEIKNMWYEKPMVPEGVKAYNPAFDVTDHKYITAVVTEKGIVYPPFDEGLKALFDEEK